jgi:hypothetical protein
MDENRKMFLKRQKQKGKLQQPEERKSKFLKLLTH